MIDTRHLGAAPDDAEKDFDAALVRTHTVACLRNFPRGASGVRMLNLPLMAPMGIAVSRSCGRTASASSAEKRAIPTAMVPAC